MMDRRAFVAGSVALLAAPLGAQVQEHGPRKVPRVGLLTDFSMAGATTQLEPFYRALRDRGWVEGQNLTFENRYGAGKGEALPGLAGDLVSLRVNVIVTIGTPATRAAKNATQTIPIVFARVGDPMGFGFVRSLARPAGNLTGVSVLNVELGAKRLELLRDAIPHLTRVGVLWDPSFPPAQPELREIEEATRSLDRENSTRGGPAFRGVRARLLGDEKAACGRGPRRGWSSLFRAPEAACRPRGQDPATDDGSSTW